MNEVNSNLLMDLARLARRYPPEDWLTIADWLQDDTRRNHIINLIQEISSISKQLRSENQKGRLSSVARLLKEIRSEDQRKADLLEDFWHNLRSREMMPSLRSLSLFAEIAGLKNITHRKREQAVNDLMRQLADMSYDDICIALNKTSAVPRDFGEEYERWVSLILGRETSSQSLQGRQ